MLADLARAIEELDILADGDGLLQAIALRDRLDARISEAIAAYEATGWWGLDASTSMIAWLRAHAGMTRRAAQRLRTTAARLRSLPVCAAAYADGTLSGGQIEAILAQLDEKLVEIFAQQEAELVPYLIPLNVAGVARAMSAWKSRVVEETEPNEPERSLYLSPTLDDRWVLDGSLDAEGGSVVAAAIRLAGQDDDAGDPRRPATRRADALVAVCRHFLDHQRKAAGGRHRPHLNVVVELEALELGAGGRVIDGPPVDRATSPGCCATARSTGSSRRAVPPSSTTGPPPAPSPRRSGTPWSSGTSTAGSPHVTGRPSGAKATMWSGSPTAGRPSWPTSSCCAPGTTTDSTNPAGTPSSAPTPPSR